MERVNKVDSQKRSFFATRISDVGGGPATLHVSNGGDSLPNPEVGDFWYDFSNRKVSVYFPNEWRDITLNPTDLPVRHPGGLDSEVAFTQKARPYWRPASSYRGRNLSASLGVDQILDKFKDSCDSTIIAVQTVRDSSSALKRKLDKVPGDDPNGRENKRVFCATDSSQNPGMKNPSRFVNSGVGFPKDSEKVRWDAGFETFQPFTGRHRKNDEDKLLVKALARCRSSESSGSERCNSEVDSFNVQDLIVELELPPYMKYPQGNDKDTLNRAWTDFVDQINSYLQKSTSVVVRGWTPGLTPDLSKRSLRIHSGDLGQPCQWVDGVLYANNSHSKGKSTYHKFTTLDEFVDLVEDPSVCGNLLDGKDVKPNHPDWVPLILDSVTAWNQTMHLKATLSSTDKLVAHSTGPTSIHPAIWNSQGWRLLTHPGFVTKPHHDCCGTCTLVIGSDGAKIWGVMRPKRKDCPDSISSLRSVLENATELSKEGLFSEADVASVCLEKGDVMFQSPAVLHTVYTPVPSIFTGCYFFSYSTMAQTRAALSLKTVNQKGSLTNDERPGVMRTLSRMLIALKYRSEPRRITKKNLLSLILIILDPQFHHRNGRSPSAEERGDIALASECAHALLTWMKLTLEEARTFVDYEGPYYFGGEEEIEIPALKKGAADLIFNTETSF